MQNGKEINIIAQSVSHNIFPCIVVSLAHHLHRSPVGTAMQRSTFFDLESINVIQVHIFESRF